MLANREGLFHAYPLDIGLGESRQNKLLQVSILYRLFEESAGGEWTDCSAENLEITGYHILEKRDHSLNESTIESLKAALGWDGRDPFWLQDNAQQLSQQPVQVKLAFEEYEGKQSLKVQLLNPYGSQHAIAKADDGLRRAVGNRLGAKFRALAGGTPANPPKPAGAPAAPASKPASTQPAPAAPPAAKATATMEEAWAVFTKAYSSRPGGNDKDMQDQWFRIIGELFTGKQPDQLSGAEWAVMMEKGPLGIIPF